MRNGILLALALAACARGSVPAETAAAGEAAAVSVASGDTLRGTLQVTGSEPGVIFVLVDGAGRATTLEGDRAVLARLSAMEIAVRGVRGTHAFRVEGIAIRAVGGVPAVDGVLARAGERDLLVLESGERREVARLPEALRGQVGAWVWLAGSLEGNVDSWGVISDAGRP